MFIPPSVRNSTPRHYTSAFDISWGARIVVAFSEDIFLYSVPPDICSLSREEQKAQSSEIYSNPPFCRESRALDHWLNWWDEHCNTDRCDDHPVWPIAVRGTAIATLPDVCKLVIHTKPNLTIWAFTMDAQCRVWQLRNSVDSSVRTDRYVCQNGVVHTVCTTSGVSCSKEHNISSLTSFSPFSRMPGPSHENPADERLVGLDGLCPEPLPTEGNTIDYRQQSYQVIPKALSAENDDWVDFVDVRGCDAWFEQNGDVTMVPRNQSVRSLED
ncbi:hypothetical protein DM02DRAFT_657964 [Periconia macrospinosa]|uniref:Uncharacterized protein n=1 Tax=Periconia macrospinosa TaxID=97972 RepID=A0A2V1DHY9_9PLEO|nr:hypothetical protein DM02DRAFT_657964 [Periconia macrospinosa]